MKKLLLCKGFFLINSFLIQQYIYIRGGENKLISNSPFARFEPKTSDLQ